MPFSQAKNGSACPSGLARRVVNTWCDSVRNGWLGRRMPLIFSRGGLKQIEVVPHTLLLTLTIALPLLGQTTVDRAVENGTMGESEARAWLEHMVQLQNEGRFFSTMTGYLVSATR